MRDHTSRAKLRKHEDQFHQQKCDAKQPCTTCVKGDRSAACKYERSRSSREFPFKSPSPSPGRVLPAPSDSRSSYSLPLDPGERLQPSYVPDEVVPVLSPGTPAIGDVPGTTKRPPHHTVPPLTILPPVHVQAVPRPSPPPSSVISPERLQVSWVSGNDLGMSLYVVFLRVRKVSRAGGAKGMIFGSRLRALCQLNKLGLYLTQDKQEAILRGDTSHVVICNFVNGFQMLGMYLSAPKETPTMVLLQARYLQRAWESLIQLTQTSRERDKAQALVLVAHGFIILRLNSTAQLYFLKACKIIEKEKLQFLPDSGPTLGFSEQVREDASVLSQAIYLENYLYLTLGGPAPGRTARVEREFRSDLQVRAICHLFRCRTRNRSCGLV